MKSIHQTILFRMLHKLTPDELDMLHRYGEFARPSLQIRKAIALFWSGEVKDLDRKGFFRACQGDQAPDFSSNRLQTFLHKVREFVFEFLAVQALRNDPINLRFNALRSVQQMGWDDEAPKIFRSLQKRVNKAPDDLLYYKLNHSCEEIMHEVSIHTGLLTQNQQMARSWEKFENLMLVNCLRYHCTWHDLELNGRDVNDRVPLPDMYLENLLIKSHKRNLNLVEGFVAIMEMQKVPRSADRFRKSHAIICDLIDSEKVSNSAAGELLTLHFNHALRLCLSDLIGWDVVSNILSMKMDQHRGVIHPRVLKNTIAILTNYGSVAQARQIWERFQKQIIGDPNGHARNYNHAVILFFEKDFEAAVKIFEEVIYATEDLYLKADGRLYLWRGKIELALQDNLYDAHFFEYEKEKTRQFFRRTKALNRKKDSIYMQYPITFRKLYDALGRNKQKRKAMLDALWKDISQFKEHPLRHWLIEKLKTAEQL